VAHAGPSRRLLGAYWAPTGRLLGAYWAPTGRLLGVAAGAVPHGALHAGIARDQRGVRLIEEDWSAIQLSGEEPWTQAIGRGAAEARFEGILVPSARQLRGKNAVIFPGNLRRGSTVEAMAKEDLPPPPKEWPDEHAILHVVLLFFASSSRYHRLVSRSFGF